MKIQITGLTTLTQYPNLDLIFSVYEGNNENVLLELIDENKNMIAALVVNRIELVRLANAIKDVKFPNLQKGYVL